MLHTSLLKSRIKLALLAIGWVVWFLLSGGIPLLAQPAVSESSPLLAQATIPPPPAPVPMPSPSAPVPIPQPPAPLPLPPAPVPPPAAGQPTGGGLSVQLQNPLSRITSIPELLEALLTIFIILVLPIIIFFIMLAGFKFVSARGNTSTLEEAKRALLYAIIGAILILGATAITRILKNLVNAFMS